MDDCCYRFDADALCDAPFRVLELYSGIGGLHWALHVAGIPHSIAGAFDVNSTVNLVYCLNFSKTPLVSRNIVSLTAKEIERLKPDIITMCPPCQPFTRVGLKQDSDDPRSESFLHVLNTVAELKTKPSYLFMENVKGFECSSVRGTLIHVLQESGYVYQEFLLSPTQFGIPNSRLRYYMLAKLKPMSFPFTVTEEVQTSWPSDQINIKVCTPAGVKNQCHFNVKGSEILPLHQFLEDEAADYFKEFLLPDKILLRYANVLDIVDRNQCTSCCFTKAYGHYVQGTGSVLHMNEENKVADIYEEVQGISDQTLQLDLLRKLRLRYFTPKEVANIMCFPDAFRFPAHLTAKQKYRALGNSVNVCVVSCLLQLLISGDN